jgi:hypothetical protein
MSEKESLQSHRKVRQAKRCDEGFCLRIVPEVPRISEIRSNESEWSFRLF